MEVVVYFWAGWRGSGSDSGDSRMVIDDSSLQDSSLAMVSVDGCAPPFDIILSILAQGWTMEWLDSTYFVQKLVVH